MAKNLITVVTADLIGSRVYGRPERTAIDRTIRSTFTPSRLKSDFPGLKLAAFGFRITVGDEFQFVTTAPSPVLEFITHLRARLTQLSVEPMPMFRASIGIGAATLTRSPKPYEQDGPAFVHSRAGLDAITKGRGRSGDRLTAIVTGDPDRDAELDKILAIWDHMQRRWTASQWEAVDWALRGTTLKQAAHRIGIRHQNVSKRLHAAGWPEANGVIEVLSSWMFTPKRVQA